MQRIGSFPMLYFACACDFLWSCILDFLMCLLYKLFNYSGFLRLFFNDFLNNNGNL